MQRSEFSDDQDMRELIDLYVSRLPAEIARLNALLAGGDLEALRKLAHQLKGSGGGYGFPRVTELAAIVDHSINQGVAVEQVRAEVEALIRYIRDIDGYASHMETDNAAAL